MKGQSEIIGYVMLFLIGIGLVGTAIIWGIPLIHKKQDAKKMDDIYNFFLLLNEKIKSVAKGGVEETLTFPAEGVATLFPSNYNGIENNSIVFSISSKVSNVVVGEGWIPITTANLKESPHAILGIDQPSVIFAKSTKVGEYFEVNYRLWLRGLYDPATGKTHKIVLVREDGKPDALSSTSRIIHLKHGRTYEMEVNGKTYLVTEVVIIL